MANRELIEKTLQKGEGVFRLNPKILQKSIFSTYYSSLSFYFFRQRRNFPQTNRTFVTKKNICNKRLIGFCCQRLLHNCRFYKKTVKNGYLRLIDKKP